MTILGVAEKDVSYDEQRQHYLQYDEILTLLTIPDGNLNLVMDRSNVALEW